MPEPTPTETPEPAVQRIAYIGTDGDVWIINADGSGEKKLFDLDLLGRPTISSCTGPLTAANSRSPRAPKTSSTSSALKARPF